MAGNLEIVATNTGSLRLMGGGTFNINIGGNLQVDGGTLVLTSTTGSPVVQVNGNLSQTSGVIDLQLSGAGGLAELRVRGNVSLSGGQFKRSGSATPKLEMNGSALQTFSSAVALGSGVQMDVSPGASVQILSNLVLASFTTLTVSGTLDGGAYAIQGHTLTVTNGGNCKLGSGGYSQVNSGSLNVNAGGVLDVGAANLTMLASISAAMNVAGRLTIGSGSVGVASSGGTNPLNVSNDGVLELGSGTVTMGSGAVTVYAGGTVRCGTGVIIATGSASFSLLTGTRLETAAADGITVAGATGSIRTPTRSFAAGARYVYDAVGVQSTGSGLPSTVRALSVTGGGTVGLSASVTADSGVTVTRGRSLSTVSR